MGVRGTRAVKSGRGESSHRAFASLFQLHGGFVLCYPLPCCSRPSRHGFQRLRVLQRREIRWRLIVMHGVMPVRRGHAPKTSPRQLRTLWQSPLQLRELASSPLWGRGLSLRRSRVRVPPREDGISAPLRSAPA